MNFFSKILKQKTGQAIMEYVLVLLVISAAAAAINTTYQSTESLIGNLATNIRETNITSSTSYVPPNAFIENTWGVTPLDGSPLYKQEGSTGILTDSGAIYDPGADNLIPPEERELTGKYLPIAYFTANQPSTFDELTIYDYSYDLDSDNDANLKKFWKIQKKGNLTAPDFDNTELRCSDIDSCKAETNTAKIWDTRGFTAGTFTRFTQLGGKNSFTYANPRDIQLLEEGYCFGSAAQCIPEHLSNGYYTISLIVMDKDNNETAVYTQDITIQSRTVRVAYKYVYGEPRIISKIEVPTNMPEERLLVDHQYGLVTDLYGVKHPVIEMNMIRKSTSKKYRITTVQDVKVYAYLVSIDTGEEINEAGYPYLVDSYEQESTKEVFDTGNAGFESESGDDGNLWYTEKMHKNKWKFYIYDKRSLFNKRFITDVGAAIDASIDQVANPTKSNGATYITNGNSFANSVYNSLKGQSSPATNETTWTEKNNGILNGVYNDADESEITGETTHMHISQSHARYPAADKNSNMSAYADVKGYSNTLYIGTTTVANNKEAVTTGFDFEEHQDHPTAGAAGFVRDCIKNCGNKRFKQMDEVPDVSIIQLQSNYALLDDEKGTTIPKVTEPFSDDIYRDQSDDFSDGSRMYQLRTNVSGTDNGQSLITDHDNDLDPEFVSVRLSLNDFYGYNPGANLNTLDSGVKTAELEANFRAQLTEAALEAEDYPTNYNYGDHKSYTDAVMGCNECTEPNFNTDGKMQWTEYRKVTGSVNPGGTAYNGSHCTASANYPSVSLTINMDARTRQYNWVEHTAFDWVYEYSGEGDNSALKATNGTVGNRTIKIRRSHWHTVGRKLEEITMGRYSDPYTNATRNNKPYEGVTDNYDGISSTDFNTAIKDIRFLTINNDKSPLTASDTETTGNGAGSDGSGREAFWKILKGSASKTERSAQGSCSTDLGCTYGGTHMYYAKVVAITNMNITYTGLGEEVVTYTTSQSNDSYSVNNCAPPPPPPDSGGGE